MLTEQASPGAVPAPERASPDRSRLRLAVLCDYPEEDWPSMDLCAEMLLTHAGTDWADEVAAAHVCPPFRRRLGALRVVGRRSWAHNGDRFLNRYWHFPRHVRGCRGAYDVFHICDHSYAQLALELPGERTGVLCHDADAFRCLVEPDRDRRPAWFRRMMRRVLAGLQRAAVVFHTTEAVKADLVRYELVAPEKLVFAPLGTAPEFSPQPRFDDTADRKLAALGGRPFLLHVGSCIPRKRVEVLLRVFAAVRTCLPELRLIKVGGSWSREQEDLIRRLRIQTGLIHLRDLTRSTLAALYRRAALVLLPSEAEGFGLPVLEALACGTSVLASDLPVFREVGGPAITFAPCGELDAWKDATVRLLTRPETAPSLAARLAQARKYSWQEHARIILDAYRKLAS